MAIPKHLMEAPLCNKYTCEEIKQLKQELQKYEKTIYKIEKYINSYSPYFLETQEENNKKIATIIHEELK